MDLPGKYKFEAGGNAEPSRAGSPRGAFVLPDFAQGVLSVVRHSILLPGTELQVN
jgi:hypothetical protein